MDETALRDEVWDALAAHDIARSPRPPHGRLPNFVGADRAAERLASTAAWAAADVVEITPDAPQRPVRRRAVRAGKTVYVAVPRLRDPQCFRRLDPAVADVDRATTADGAVARGEPVRPAAVDPVDLVVSGSVAVTEDGTRLGTGEGDADLGFALLREHGRVDDDTTTATTVHERQVVDAAVPSDPHDVPMDRVVTPERVVRAPSRAKPSGIAWERLDATRPEAVPALRALRPAE